MKKHFQDVDIKEIRKVYSNITQHDPSPVYSSVVFLRIVFRFVIIVAQIPPSEDLPKILRSLYQIGMIG